MTRRRWKLITLWLTAAILTVIATGACLYSVARSAVERDAPNLFGGFPGEQYTTDVRFRKVRISNHMWVTFEFDVTFHPDDNSAVVGPFHWQWRLRDRDAVFVFYD